MDFLLEVHVSSAKKFLSTRFSRSNDDLFVLLAVMELGINAYFLTNDSFLNHRNMLTPSGQLLFDRWVEKRAVRLDNRDIIVSLQLFEQNIQTRWCYLFY